MILKIKNENKVSTHLISTVRPKSPVFQLPEYQNRPKVSFCITHKNRFHQIAETLTKNLNDNRIDEGRVEFILVDFGSDHDMKNWVADQFSAEISSEYLKFFHTSKLEKWHAPIAKNTAHRLSTGQILVNLDGDNFTGYRGGQFVYEHFMENQHDICCWQFSGRNGDGSFGRIASARDTFFGIGGYNEELLEMGFQDRDLVRRLEMSGVKVVLALDESYNHTLENDQYEPKEMAYASMRLFNKKIAKRIVKKDNLKANGNTMGIQSGIKQLVITNGKISMIDV